MEFRGTVGSEPACDKTDLARTHSELSRCPNRRVSLASLLLLAAWTVLFASPVQGQGPGEPAKAPPAPPILLQLSSPSSQPLVPPLPAAAQPTPPASDLQSAPPASQGTGSDKDVLRDLLQRIQHLEAKQAASSAGNPVGLQSQPSGQPEPLETGGVPFPAQTPRGNPIEATDPTATIIFQSLVGDNPVYLAVGGQYRVMFDAPNFQNHSTTLGNNQPLYGFANERLRTWLEIVPNDNVSAYIQVQMGSFLLGANNDFAKTFAAPLSVNNDQVGIMLRRGYLQFQNEELGRFRVGVQDFSDSFGDTLASAVWDFNVGGIAWDKTFKEFNDLKLALGCYILTESGALNSANAYLVAFDGTQPITDKLSAGLSVYYLPDFGDYSYPTVAPYQWAQDVWIGVRAKGEIECVKWNAWAIYNYGDRVNADNSVFVHSGEAYKFEFGGVEFGPGKITAQTLFSTGGHQGTNSSGEFRTVAQSEQDNFGSQGYWGYLPLISPYGPTDVNDMGVSLQNRGLGLFTVQGKYEIPLASWLTATSAAGYLRSEIPNPVSNSFNIGSELAETFTVDFGGGLKLDVGGAWLFTGDFYRNGISAPHPNDLGQLFARLQFIFGGGSHNAY